MHILIRFNHLFCLLDQDIETHDFGGVKIIAASNYIPRGLRHVPLNSGIENVPERSSSPGVNLGGLSRPLAASTPNSVSCVTQIIPQFILIGKLQFKYLQVLKFCVE